MSKAPGQAGLAVAVVKVGNETRGVITLGREVSGERWNILAKGDFQSTPSS